MAIGMWASLHLAWLMVVASWSMGHPEQAMLAIASKVNFSKDAVRAVRGIIGPMVRFGKCPVRWIAASAAG
jgi:hypothetical protein